MDVVTEAGARAEREELRFARMIEKRSPKGEADPDETEIGYMESVRRFNERSAAEMRSRWVSYHEHMTVLHTRLAEEHREKAQKLVGEDEPAKLERKEKSA